MDLGRGGGYATAAPRVRRFLELGHLRVLRVEWDGSGLEDFDCNVPLLCGSSCWVERFPACMVQRPTVSESEMLYSSTSLIRTKARWLVEPTRSVGMCRDVMVLVGDVSGYVWLIPVKSCPANFVSRRLIARCAAQGRPLIWVSENGSYFRKRVVRKGAAILRVQH